MDYFEYIIRGFASGEQKEIFTAVLSEMGCESFVEEEDVLKAYIPYTDSGKAAIDAHLAGSGLEYNVTVIPDRNWNEEWERNYQPVLIREDCLVRAPFHDARPDIRYDIVIEPRMAFGTAHHETTSQMMCLLLDMDIEFKSILDMGCGTAVLAILASKMGANNVVAIDNDEWAYNNAMANIMLNQTFNVMVYQGDAGLLEGKKFDVILANINRNILIRDIPTYVKTMEPGGILAVSGFYTEDLGQISACCQENGMKFTGNTQKNNWVAAGYVKE